MVEALDLDGKAVLPSHQLVLQLSHVGLVCWLGQVVHQDVDEEVEQHQAEGEESRWGVNSQPIWLEQTSIAKHEQQQGYN